MTKRIVSIIVSLALVFSLLTSMNVSASAEYEESYSVSVTTGDYYTLYNYGSGKFLNVAGSKNLSSTNVTVYQQDYTSGQDFAFLDDGNGHYTLKPRCAESCRLNVYGQVSKSDSNVNIWTASGNPTQSWIVEYNPTLAAFAIKPSDNLDLALTASGSKNTSNVCLKTYDPNDYYQAWSSNAITCWIISTEIDLPSSSESCGDVEVMTDTYVTLENAASGRFLNIKGSRSASGTDCTVYQEDYTSGQDFMFLSDGNGCYTIKPRCATSCRLNASGTYAYNKQNVNIYTASGNPTQSWKVVYNESLGGYAILSADNIAYALTASGGLNGNTCRLEEYSEDNKYQVWRSAAFPEPSEVTSYSYNLCWPIPKSVSNYNRITSSIGSRKAPVEGASVDHKGIDIGVASKSDVLAVADGKVMFVGKTSKRGNYIVIYHEDLGLTSVYQHLSSSSVSVGDYVSKGDVIAKSGATGNVTGAHLHLELVLTSSAPSSVDCAWATGAQILDGHYENTLINYEFQD